VRSKPRATGAPRLRSVGGVTHARQRLGRRGEELAAAELERRGWRVVARNARMPGIRGELDIVALDGGSAVFVEVKTVSAGNETGPASPLEMVGPRKQAQLRRLAGAWLERHRGELPHTASVRIDVVGIVLDRGGDVVSWHHVPAAC
jgi:putative endonuclease